MTSASGLLAEAEAPKTWTIGEIVKWATDDFRTRGIENPGLDAQLIVAFALNVTRTQIIVDSQRPLTPDELAKLRALIKRRRSREPMAYLMGHREFYGRSFKVDARVLIPRPDTETLVEVALTRTRAQSMYARVLDLCTGSGCVATTLAKERPTTRVTGIDKSAGAVAVARDNAARLGVTNVWFTESDLFQNVRGPFEIITANPPYIATDEIPTLQPEIDKFEPKLALDGGKDGLDLVRKIAAEAGAHLVPGGVLAMEVGAGQAPETADVLRANGFTSIEIAKDYGRIERVVSGVLGERPGEQQSGAGR
jgi:release factor glutamine methyltransferase